MPELENTSSPRTLNVCAITVQLLILCEAGDGKANFYTDYWNVVVQCLS